MKFQKGQVPWNKGKTMNKEQKEKLSLALLSRTSWNKGLTKDDKRVMKGIETRRLNGNNITSEETKIKLRRALKGRYIGNGFKLGHKHKKETKEKISNKIKKQWESGVKIKDWITPTKDTSIEIKIQNYLKQLGITFFTHQYIKEIEHGYQCDILIPSLNMIVECDGNYWHKYPYGREIDKIRTSELLEKGFKVLRLWEHEINSMTLNNLKMRLQI